MTILLLIRLHLGVATGHGLAQAQHDSDTVRHGTPTPGTGPGMARRAHAVLVPGSANPDFFFFLKFTISFSKLIDLI